MSTRANDKRARRPKLDDAELKVLELMKTMTRHGKYVLLGSAKELALCYPARLATVIQFPPQGGGQVMSGIPAPAGVLPSCNPMD